MLDDRALRAADPVAGWRVDSQSAQAQALLAAILTSPPNADAPKAHRRFALQHAAGNAGIRRVVLGGAALVTAAAVGVIATTLWDTGPGQPAAAYAVTTKSDGTVQLLVRWDQLNDPAGLAAILRKAGVPTIVTTKAPTRYCAAGAARDQANAALNKSLGGDEYAPPFSQQGYLMRPSLFPPNSTLVIASFNDSAQKVRYNELYLAPTNSPSCALSYQLGSAKYIGPTPYPTFGRMEVFPELPPTS